jgi:hypothetical protein
MISREYEQWLHNVLESMSPQMRAVFKLCQEQNKSYGEVADLLQISKSHSKETYGSINARNKRSAGSGLGDFYMPLLFITLHNYHQG